MKLKALSLFASAALLASCGGNNSNTKPEPTMITGGSDIITYIGRTDKSDPNMPKQWAAGGYLTFAYQGNGCEIFLNTEYDHLNVEIAVDDLPTMPIRTKGHKNRIVIGQAADIADTTISTFQYSQTPKDGVHHVTITRNSETMHGYSAIDSIKADGISKWTPDTKLKIEFIGNSITSGCDADTNYMPSKQYNWGDWHRAYYGYAPRTARALNAQYSLASVSGIGLIHSCCDMGIVLADVYDKYVMRNNEVPYAFGDFAPDIVCCALGQNDGVQDSLQFRDAYVSLIKTIYAKNPSCKQVVLLSSPMADDTLRAWMQNVLPATVAECEAQGIKNVSYLMFSKRWTSGGNDHPNVPEHEEIAKELTDYLMERVK